jgi:hypothetical protein
MKAENGVLICVDVPFAVREDETISLFLLLLHFVRADLFNISSRGRCLPGKQQDLVQMPQIRQYIFP